MRFPSKGFVCRRCGEVHEELPLVYEVDAPQLWYDIPPEEQPHRGRLSDDTCVIDDRFFFITGRIIISISGSGQFLTWKTWVCIRPEDFSHLQEQRRDLPPFTGYLASEIPGYSPSSLNLKTLVNPMQPGMPPLLELQSSSHPLALEQQRGIIWERVQQIAEFLLHGEKKIEKP